MKKHSILRLLLMNTIILSVCVIMISGCSQAESKESLTEQQSSQFVYVCSESNEVFIGGPMKVPALNPQTAEKTLQHGMYCKECESWHATPPLEITGGNHVKIKCPTSKTILVPDGPFPKKAVTLKNEKESTL